MNLTDKLIRDNHEIYKEYAGLEQLGLKIDYERHQLSEYVNSAKRELANVKREMFVIEER